MPEPTQYTFLSIRACIQQAQAAVVAGITAGNAPGGSFLILLDARVLNGVLMQLGWVTKDATLIRQGAEPVGVTLTEQINGN